MNAELDPRAIDVHGNNAVHQAAAASQLAVMKLFMSAGVDLDVANNRGHKAMDLATDPEIKKMIKQSGDQTHCHGNKCGKSQFTFQNTQYYCQECDKFYCKRCCLRYRVYEDIESQAKEKMVCRCEKCNQVIVDSEAKLKQAMETGHFQTVDTVLHAILKGEVDIDIKLKHEAKRLHLRLEKELDIRNFINSVQHVDNYKTIRKSVKILTEKQDTAEALGVKLDVYLVDEISQCVARLLSERELRASMETTEVPSCETEHVDDF